MTLRTTLGFASRKTLILGTRAMMKSLRPCLESTGRFLIISLRATSITSITTTFGSRFEDSPVSWVDSPVSGSSSPTSEVDRYDDLAAPSSITLKAIRKHSNRRHGIYGSLVGKDIRESPLPELLADSPASDSTSPTSVGSESDEFEALSANVLKRSREHLNRRLGIFGDTSKQVLSPSEVPFPVSVDDAVACDPLPSRRQRLLSTHSLRPQRKRVSGLQPLQLPRIVSMRHLALGDPLPPKDTFRRVSHWVHEPRGSAGA
jgi:hypothetical protein